MKAFGTNLKIIYKNNKPYGIRDNTGYLLFFCKIPKFDDQEERYRADIDRQFKQAGLLLNAMKLND